MAKQMSRGKLFALVAVSVLAGIYLWSKLSGTAKQKIDPTTTYLDAKGTPIFAGPDVDPYTGAYKGPNARVGTVEFPAQGN